MCNEFLFFSEAISDPIRDGPSDAIVYAIFQTSRALPMSAVCAFRMSQVDAIFDHGRFKVAIAIKFHSQFIDPTLTNFTLDAVSEILPKSDGQARSLHF